MQVLKYPIHPPPPSALTQKMVVVATCNHSQPTLAEICKQYHIKYRASNFTSARAIALQPIKRALLHDKLARYSIIQREEGKPIQTRIFDYLEWWKLKEWKGDVKRLFIEYLEDIRDKKLVFRRKEDNKALYLDYTVRFQPKRLKKIKGKLYNLKIRKGVLITLGLDPKRSENVIDYKNRTAKEWNRILIAIKRHFKLKEARFLKIAQFGEESELLHYHILFEFLKFTPEDLKWLHSILPKEHINVEQIRNVRVLNYVLRYIKRSFGNTDIILDTPAYLYWVTNVRFFDCSHKLNEEIKANHYAFIEFRDFFALLEGETPNIYEFLGAYYIFELGDPPPKYITKEWITAYIK